MTADRFHFADKGATTAASIVPIWMPPSIPSLTTTGTAWEDDYYSLLPSLHTYFNGLMPGDSLGWTPGECLTPPGTPLPQGVSAHGHPNGFAAVIGIANFTMLNRMISDGFQIADWALRSAEQIGTTNLSNVHLNPNRVLTSSGQYSIYSTITFNSMEVHGFAGIPPMMTVLNMKPSNYSGTPGGSWFDVTSILTGANMSQPQILYPQNLWSEGVLGHGPGLGHSTPLSISNAYSDSLYYTDPTSKRIWEYLRDPADGTFGMGNFSARPKPGYWSFWFVCPRTERISPVWFNRAGCPQGSISASEANAHDVNWFPDNWALNADYATGMISTSYSSTSQVWDIHSGDVDSVTQTTAPLFSGINAYTSTRYSYCCIRPLKEFQTQGYSFVQQALEFKALTRGKATGNAHKSIIGCLNVGTQSEPSAQLCAGIGLSHPVSIAPEADMINDVTGSFTTFTFDSTIGRDAVFGQLGYATQVDDEYDSFYVTNGSLQCLRFGPSGFLGEAYTQPLTRTNGCFNRSFDGTEIQRWVSSTENALQTRVLGNEFSGQYVAGNESGLSRTNTAITGGVASSIASSMFFMPTATANDPLARVYGCTYAIAIGVSNEFRLPIYRTQ